MLQEELMKRLFVYLSIAAFLVSVGCAQKNEAEKAAPKDFLVKINNTYVTSDDFMEKFDTLPAWAQKRFTDDEGKKQFVNEIIKEELLYQEAVSRGIDNEPHFQKKIKEFKRMTLVSEMLKNEVEGKSTVKEQELRDFYERHKDTFTAGEEVKASHILVDTEAEAEDIMKKILKKESFSELAKQLSKDHTSAIKGGDLGFFGKGRMVSEFDKVAFELDPGEVSDPVKTQFGYHIIKVIEKRMSKQRDFDEVKSVIERRLKAEKQKTLFDTYIKSLREKSATEINEEALKSLDLGLSGPAGGQEIPSGPHG
jgi:peptidyl-prolyl cis-trans isomerase C